LDVAVEGMPCFLPWEVGRWQLSITSKIYWRKHNRYQWWQMSASMSLSQWMVITANSWPQSTLSKWILFVWIWKTQRQNFLSNDSRVQFIVPVFPHQQRQCPSIVWTWYMWHVIYTVHCFQPLSSW
jgi:hypothetical protein